MKLFACGVIYAVIIQQSLAAEPPLYPYPAPDSITVEDLVPAAMNVLRQPRLAPPMEPGEKVLIVSDRSVDPLTTEAYYVAAWRLGARQVDSIQLQGRPEVTDPTELILELFEKNWWPQWVWDAAAGYDRLIPTAYINIVNGMEAISVPGKGWTPKWSHDTNTAIVVTFATENQRERLAAARDYPSELVYALIKHGYDTMRAGHKYHLTDVNGTDLTWTIDEQVWQRYLESWGTGINNHAPRLHLSDAPDMRGTLVSTHLHSGKIPRMEMAIEGGKVISVKGGGKLGDYLRNAYEQYADVQYPMFPGPGVSWVEYAVWGFDPTPDFGPLPADRNLGWSGKLWSQSIDLKAGVVHLAIGTTAGGFNNKFSRDNGYPNHHKDIVLFHPTLIIDGETVIERGHLTALNDPEIRAIAAKYGDPDELLIQRWRPDDDPRFAQ
ncbi:MAG: hypothetical protein OES09_14935 [Gammaproteobacteria bacterium]|nr:hypothetical protein [Gammaproteobacteria bacterium]